MAISSVSVFDNYRFKTAFNEELYNTIVKNKKVITEVYFDLMDDEYPEIREQIALCGWRRLAAPKPEISIDLIHEFYANAIITEMEELGGHSYKSFVRGVPVNFSPDNIRSVMRFKAQVEGARIDFETRKEHDQQLDSVLADLSMPGATWKLSTGQQRVPIQLRRQELNPIARGWHELLIHSLIPSSNRSEIPVIRAILIHCIMNGEDVRAEEIIADKMVRMAQGIKEKGKLGFPSTIYKLCKEAGVPLREFRRTKILVEKPITARRMESTRLPRNLQHQPQNNEDEDQPMPQAEEGHGEEQGEEHDYQHHQPEYDHQPEFQHEPQIQQPLLYEIPTYTDQHEKDLHSIEEQLQNMMWYQQQCLENINKSQAEYMAELRTIKGKQQEMYENNNRFYNQVREEQWEMAKEIQQVKNYQVNQTMVESARNTALMEELAAVRSRQEELFSNQTNQYNMIRQEQKFLGKEILDRQLNEWTRNSSARECYSVWAHQQANPNLVEMPVHKLTKQIYDNANNNRPMFYGFLKSDLPPSETTPPPPKSKDPHNAPN
ncbi:hypothetical protein PIB30_092301 [Stylosanthes scabra]|uniref:Putative plant transposon protein domain-containing protein n=1 Tax=Stylosanthes scabra TaxID=79078 RepID=A0ABU6YSG4_9FABA|nr:hypothetical protein [Stylosanthes scabra]